MDLCIRLLPLRRQLGSRYVTACVHWHGQNISSSSSYFLSISFWLLPFLTTLSHRLCDLFIRLWCSFPTLKLPLPQKKPLMEEAFQGDLGFIFWPRMYSTVMDGILVDGVHIHWGWTSIRPLFKKLLEGYTHTPYCLYLSFLAQFFHISFLSFLRLPTSLFLWRPL